MHAASSSSAPRRLGAGLGELLAERLGGVGRGRARPAAARVRRRGGARASAAIPRGLPSSRRACAREAILVAAATRCYPSAASCHAARRRFPGAAPPGGADSDRRKERGNRVTDYEILLLLDPELAEEKQADIVGGSAPCREGRRDVRAPRPVGTAQARLSDRQEGGGRLPPPELQRDRRDARRALARAEDRRRRDPSHGDTSARGGSVRASSGGRRDRRRCRRRPRGRPGERSSEWPPSTALCSSAT